MNAKLHWVGQEDAWGCGFAALAMLLGRTYEDMKGDLQERALSHGIDFNDMDERLIDAGYALQRRYQIRYTEGHGADRHKVFNEPWPPKPWAPLHYANVIVSPASPGAHYVVFDMSGHVYDPLTPDRKRLTDYHRVQNVTGIWRVVSS